MPITSPLPEQTRRVLEHLEASRRLQDAQQAMRHAQEQLLSCLSLYEDCDPVAVPDGTGSGFYIVALYGTDRVFINHTSKMLAPEKTGEAA